MRVISMFRDTIFDEIKENIDGELDKVDIIENITDEDDGNSVFKFEEEVLFALNEVSILKRDKEGGIDGSISGIDGYIAIELVGIITFDVDYIFVFNKKFKGMIM